MPRLIDLTGKTFGRLTVLGRGEVRGDKIMWRCRCSCGVEKQVYGGHLRSGRSQSCGCMRNEQTGARRYKHGAKRTRLYSVWSEMKGRCYRETNPRFADYGGRGISVCSEWHDFTAFQSWASSSGYGPGLTIDRRDNDGDYSPENCRWVTNAVQASNKRNSRFIVVHGEKMTVAEASRKFGVHVETIRSRLAIGCSPEDAVLGR